jgi:hypothetical protein
MLKVMDNAKEVPKDKKGNKKKEFLFGCIPLHAIKAFWSTPTPTTKGVEA